MTAENTIGGVIHAHAANRPDNAAILAPGREPLSYAALAAFIDDIRARLNDCGIGRGDRVALAVVPRPEMTVAHLAVANAATSVPIDPNATTAEIETALVSLRATAMIASDNLSGHARDCASRLGIQILNLFPRLDAPAGLFTLSGGMPGAPAQPGPAQPNDVALTIRTSGTTSKPKVVCISHRLAVARGRIEAAAFALEHNDRCLNFRPLHLHSAINAGLMVPLSAGGGVILPAGFDAGAFFEQLVTFGATWFLGSPAYHDAILEQVRYRPDLRRRHVLRFVRSSSYRLAPEAMARLEATFGVPFLERFGGTESGLIARNPPPPADRKPGTVGVPVDSEVALLGNNGAVLGRGIADEMGEILVRGAGVFEGYENNPEADAAAFIDGWYRTGDLGRWDEDGYLIVCGRVKEVINRGGQKISPIEVEDALLRHPGIAEVACFGVPHPTLGEDIAAAIVVNDPAQGVIDTTAVAQFLAPNLAAFKIPKRVVCCEALPRGPTGKLNRLSLAATLGIASIIDEANLVTVEPAAFEGKWEAEIAAIWRDILKLSTVGYRENFFVLGGESLMAARLLARIGEMTGVDLPVECIFGDGGTVAGLAQLVRDAENGVEIAAPSSVAGPIIRRDRTAATPLSFSQERLRFLSELDPNDHIYNMQGAVRLTGSLEPNVLRRVLNAIVARHEILRASFPIIDGELRQVIAPELELDMPVIDLTATIPECREDVIQRIAREEARRRYDLARGPLIGAKLIKCEDDDHVLLLPKHHLVFDGQSSGILYREIAALYGAFARNEPSPLAELPIQFGDYAAWQRDRLSGPRLDAELAYWLDHLQGAPPLLDLPTDRPRPETQSYQGGRCWFSLSNALTEEIGSFSRRLGVTPFITLLAGFELLLHRYSGQDDFVLGTAVGGRTRPEVEELLGLFVNTLPLHARFDGVATVAEHVARVRQAAIGAYAHQDMPFDRLVSALNPDRNASYAPVVQVLFGLMPKDLRRVELDDLTFERMNIDLGTARFDLSVMIGEDHGALEGFFEYSDDLFDRATIERMIGHFEILLGRMIRDSETSLNDVDLLSAPERRRLLVEWNDTVADFPRDRSIQQIFEEQVARAPEAVALLFENHSLTYAELNTRANQLAHHLIALGVGPGVLVGLCLERSFELVIGLIAILKAGGAYVPLDPAYPKERLGFMLQDTQAAVLLTQQALVEQLPQFDGHLVCLDRNRETIEAQPVANPPCSANGESLAYVIYTSGSTGRPKGVAVPHRGVLRLLLGVDYAQLDERQTFLLLSPISFDASTFELWGALLHGARCAIFPEPVPTIEKLGKALERYRVSTLFLTTALFNLVVDEAPQILRSVRQLLSGGEAVSPTHVREALQRLPDTQLIHCYGPTESATFTSSYPIPNPSEENKFSIPIGRPITNTRLYILDRHLNPAPLGVAGELCIAGDGLARGYLNRPELTAEKFVPDPFSLIPGARMYRTGDLVRYRADGNIEFIGRFDGQIKIRGFRVEPGEIEAVLGQHPAIQQAVVVTREESPGDKQLVAYLVAQPASSFDAEKARNYLTQKLPEYMIPSAWVLLDKLPLTPNGKLDRKSLPAPLQPERAEALAIPRNLAEEILANIWSDVLKVERVGIYDNFFHLGGHSLLAIQVVSRIRDAFKIDLRIRTLFEAPTIAGIAQHVESNRQGITQTAALPILAELADGEYPASFSQERFWFLEQFQPNNPAYKITYTFQLVGPLNATALEQSLAEIIRRHESLRTTFHQNHDALFQRVSERWLFCLNVVNAPEIPQKNVERYLEAEYRRPFDLSTDLLMRAALLRLSDSEHLLSISSHHIAWDHWSIGIFFRELSALYRAFAAGKPSPLSELPIQYKHFALWQRKLLEGPEFDNHLAYWKKQLADIPANLNLPTDHPRQPLHHRRGVRKNLILSQGLKSSLDSLSKRTGVTSFVTFLAAFQTLLHRITGELDIVVGTPVAGRDRSETEGLVGVFINSLPLRTNLSGDPSFLELLARVREVVLGAYDHQEFPFEKLVKELQPKRDLMSTPIFQVFINMYNFEESGFELDGLSVSSARGRREAAPQFDIEFYIREHDDGTHLGFVYDSELFDGARIEHTLGHFQMLLEGIVADPEQRLSELPLITEPERQQILVEWNDTGRDYPKDKCVHELFENQVEKTPEAIAVVFEDHQLTYRELNQQANQLAHYLRRLGVGSETLVGICVERSIEMIIGLLGILKAGGAYLPIDPDLPRERMAFMLEDSQALFLLTQARLGELLPDFTGARVMMDSDWQEIGRENPSNVGRPQGADNLAYVIYTSGSTGKPKGVMVNHRSVVNFLASMAREPGMSETDVVLAVTTLSFDIAGLEICLPLIVGARIVLARREVAADGLRLAEQLKECRATVMQATPATWCMLLTGGWQGSRALKILSGGEALSEELAKELVLRSASLWNMYGPTETTIWSTVQKVSTTVGSIALGRPIANTQIYILDKLLNPVPIGVPGELHIGGEGLARGYLNRPELSSDKFIPNPFSLDLARRLYKTGDLACYLPDGNIVFLGRVDNQVKIRGYRIEPGEIEAVLRQHPDIRESVVKLHEDDEGSRRLVAYVVVRPEVAPTAVGGKPRYRLPNGEIDVKERLPIITDRHSVLMKERPDGAHLRPVPMLDNPVLSAADLRAFLCGKLPEHMVPSIFIFLEALPLTPNGKVDRKALPAPQPAESNQSFVAPRTPTEELLAHIWAQVLKIDKFSIDGNFFELGGDSLTAMRLVARLSQETGENVHVRTVFDKPTIRALAAAVSDSIGNEQAASKAAGL
jgi:amino acid adenylation domain-containing protein